MSALNDRPEDGKITGERIAKVIARSGLCSRRDAEVLIGEKRVSVNGAVIESAALDVLPADTVLVDGKPLSLREPPRLWRYYKPKGRVTTHKDPEGRPTVFEALPEDLPRLISIGRLDFNTEGLLLLTNDGDLARHMELPSTGWTRRYRVRAYGQIDQARLQDLTGGLTVGKVNYGPIEATLEREQGDNVWISLSIKEGKNREVRRIMEHLDLAVNRLIRVSFGPFMLGDLEPGQIEEVKTSVLKDQLGPRLSRQLGVKREPMREERRLAPARSKPTYLRRKPGDPRRPERLEEEPTIKRRRILPLDGSEAPKVEFIAEKKPRPPRFGRDGGSAGRPRREDGDARSRPAGREGGQYGGRSASPGTRSRPHYENRDVRDRSPGRDRPERRDGPAPFRNRAERDDRAAPAGAGRERISRQSSGDRPRSQDRHEGAQRSFPARMNTETAGRFQKDRGPDRPRPPFRRDGERSDNASGERKSYQGASPKPHFRRDADAAQGPFESRKPREARAERPRPQFRRDGDAAPGTRDARKPGERSMNRSGRERPGEGRAGGNSWRGTSRDMDRSGAENPRQRPAFRPSGERTREDRPAGKSFQPRGESDKAGGAGDSRQPGERPAFRSGRGREERGGGSFRSRDGDKGLGAAGNREHGVRAGTRTNGNGPRKPPSGGKPFRRREGPAQGGRPAGTRKPRPETDKDKS